MSLSVSPAPHIRMDNKKTAVMWCVFLSLAPAIIFSVVHFGLQALWTILLCVGSAIGIEALILKLRDRDVFHCLDGSVALTGVLLAFNLPPSAPWWLSVAGTVVAVAIAKHAFGGLGYNIFNPALIGRAFLLSAWPVEMTTWHLDGVSGPTPLGIFKEQGMVELLGGYSSKLDMYWNMCYGNIGGCIGETSALLLLIGGLFLLYKKIISWHIPVTYIGTVFVLGWLFAGSQGICSGDPLFYIFSGGLFLGAFYMATDMVATPLTKKGKLLFGIGCGFFTFLIRKFGAYPEGVSYSILLMNACTPLIDRYIRPRKFGNVKKG